MQPFPSEPPNFRSDAGRRNFGAAILSHGKAFGDKVIVAESKCAGRKKIHRSIQIANVACATRERGGCETISRNMGEGSGKDRAFSDREGKWDCLVLGGVISASALWNGILIT